MGVNLKHDRLRVVVFEADRSEDELQKRAEATLQCPAAVSHRGQILCDLEASLIDLNEVKEVEALRKLSSRNYRKIWEWAAEG